MSAQPELKTPLPDPEPEATTSAPAPQQAAAVATPAPKPKRIILPYVLLTVFLLTLISGPLFFISLYLPGPMLETKNVVIPRGSSVKEIASLLDQNDVLINPLLFRIAAKLRANNQLRAGEYAFQPGMNVMDVTEMMRLGKTVVRQITVAEGLTSFDIVNIVNSTPALTGEVKVIPEEGSLWPETYNYTYNDSRDDVIARMKKDAAAALDRLWQERDPSIPLRSPREALILASIVEKETGKRADERAMVASVFFNRMRIGMPLQSDPTTIYALTGGLGALGRSLTRADLLTQSPYNTYVNVGLPPTPICNPGKAALEAVLHPKPSEFLYFVADGTGGHAFAKTLTEHNDNVAKWLRLQK